MKTILMLEFAGPWRMKPKRERVGKIFSRWIWGFWSFAIYRNCGINDISKMYRKDEREECAKLVEGRADPAQEWNALHRAAAAIRARSNAPDVSGGRACEPSA